MRAFGGILMLLVLPSSVFAAGGQLHVTPVAALPFGLLLLTVAILPIVAGHWWHRNRNKGIVVALFGVPMAGYMVALGEAGRSALLHEMAEYFSFITLLASLYIVSGGIVVRGDLTGRPRTNLLFLVFGAVLANLIGTTGASMVLIRPVLRINSDRKRTGHIPVFFIFTVSNFGGLLTPLGDPPLFLGFLKGVSFFWTTALWRHWLVANGLVLAIFYVWDRFAFRRELPADIQREQTHYHRLRAAGLGINAPLLVLILLAVLFQSGDVGWAAGKLIGVSDLTLTRPWGEFVMLAAAGLSLLLSPKHLHKENRFAWGPIVEVAVLFLGIFVTMAPALALLTERGAQLGITEPWQFFWLTGGLSSFLDNAPTYVTFGTLAAGGPDFAALAANKPLILAAISCGAVFMGANSYIGNGPNFLVKAIAEEAGYPMPSFFGYIVRYTLPVLVPVSVVVTWLFFW
ncbi:MAG TPA: sodium:proton antiporter [Gemmataceae bacterium]|jgi:Na+/H+ antiporter NhaD/arsenite permease-like protein|nr:sodium:proton antiporter [Gemmataceae bacterium]